MAERTQVLGSLYGVTLTVTLDDVTGLVTSLDLSGRPTRRVRLSLLDVNDNKIVRQAQDSVADTARITPERAVSWRMEDREKPDGTVVSVLAGLTYHFEGA